MTRDDIIRMAQQAEPTGKQDLQVAPVAWRYQHSVIEQEYLTWEKGTVGRNWTPLYTAPPHCPNCASLKDDWK